MRFLANIDEVDTARAIAQLDAAETLVVVTSKSFGTRETLINACTLRQWLIEELGSGEGGISAAEITAKHIAACTCVPEAARCWGVAPELAFPFWDWVGGRYSVTSCVGHLPIALAFGGGVFDEFLEGCHAMDTHFTSAPPERNLPMMMGLLGVWNANFLHLKTRAVFPYCEALWRLPSHIQQVGFPVCAGRARRLAGRPVAWGCRPQLGTRVGGRWTWSPMGSASRRAASPSTTSWVRSTSASRAPPASTPSSSSCTWGRRGLAPTLAPNRSPLSRSLAPSLARTSTPTWGRWCPPTS